MKVTTDTALFGSFVEVEHSQRILDIGAGTGLLSLMAAQRSDATICGVELEVSAAQQARDNMNRSPWHDRLTLHHGAIQDYCAPLFDTIICNPPFFNNSFKASCNKRLMARHTDSLSFDDLAIHIDRLLTHSGSAWVLLPVEESEQFAHTALKKTGLLVRKKIALHSFGRKPAHRNILVMDKHSAVSTKDKLVIYTSDHRFTSRVTSLLTPYYLSIG